MIPILVVLVPLALIVQEEDLVQVHDQNQMTFVHAVDQEDQAFDVLAMRLECAQESAGFWPNICMPLSEPAIERLDFD